MRTENKVYADLIAVINQFLTANKSVYGNWIVRQGYQPTQQGQKTDSVNIFKITGSNYGWQGKDDELTDSVPSYAWYSVNGFLRSTVVCTKNSNPEADEIAYSDEEFKTEYGTIGTVYSNPAILVDGKYYYRNTDDDTGTFYAWKKNNADDALRYPLRYTTSATPKTGDKCYISASASEEYQFVSQYVSSKAQSISIAGTIFYRYMDGDMMVKGDLIHHEMQFQEDWFQIDCYKNRTTGANENSITGADLAIALTMYFQSDAGIDAMRNQGDGYQILRIVNKRFTKTVGDSNLFTFFPGFDIHVVYEQDMTSNIPDADPTKISGNRNTTGLFGF